MWVIRLLESFAWVVCVTDLLMCPSLTYTRLSLVRNVKMFSQETFSDRNVPNYHGLNHSIDFGRVTFEDEQAACKLLAAVGRAGQDRFLWLLPLRKVSWASLTFPNTFRVKLLSLYATEVTPCLFFLTHRFFSRPFCVAVMLVVFSFGFRSR